MSHIPNSAMPHAGPNPATDDAETRAAEGKSTSAFFSDKAGKLADTAKAHPKTAVAAGAALVAGAIAAAAIPIARSRSKSGSGGRSKKAKGQGTKSTD
ncbi:hypothetical protein [Sphingosinicella rhizophila]|uniref:Uncharacterized protein n=1 Tax=Sphingosinicella rhizophila TaxID=3050082 RepID=A0ABU3Q877_9SPHN|nr:hypothetical protein [Sphingosinicella sp. GR2756]MDT9599173.1 hypothetical protein [Sphingosinicella sp. GR2756]